MTLCHVRQPCSTQFPQIRSAVFQARRHVNTSLNNTNTFCLSLLILTLLLPLLLLIICFLSYITDTDDFLSFIANTDDFLSLFANTGEYHYTNVDFASRC